LQVRDSSWVTSRTTLRMLSCQHDLGASPGRMSGRIRRGASSDIHPRGIRALHDRGELPVGRLTRLQRDLQWKSSEVRSGRSQSRHGIPVCHVRYEFTGNKVYWTFIKICNDCLIIRVYRLIEFDVFWLWRKVPKIVFNKEFEFLMPWFVYWRPRSPKIRKHI